LILASDGVANTGETDQQRILDRVADFTARQVDLTTIGVGMNNHNDVFLEQMANKGDGACHYVDDFDEAKRIFIDKFTGTMQTIARDVKIQVEFDKNSVRGWRQIGYENRSLQDHQFRDDSVDAGEVGAGHEIVALYEVELEPEASKSSDVNLATVRLRWKPDGAKSETTGGVVPAVEKSFQMGMAQVQQAWAETAPRFRMAAVVAQYAEFMRRSYHARGDDYSRLELESERLVAELIQDEQVRELRDLIRKTRDLVRYQPPTDELWKLIEESRRLSLLKQEMQTLEERTAETSELMAELQEANSQLETRIREHLEGKR
jgi:Ca-activated chloride channel family protein